MDFQPGHGGTEAVVRAVSKSQGGRASPVRPKFLGCGEDGGVAVGRGELGARFSTSLFHQPDARLPDDEYLSEWTTTLATRIARQR